MAEKIREDIFENLEQDVKNSGLSEDEVKEMLKNIIYLKEQKINIMITGATGCGKSSTINALFDANVAKVGVGVDPETMEIKKYTLKNLILWDSPGLGDGKEADARHSENIIKKLKEVDENGNPLIDLVLVILVGGSKALGTSYELINSVIIPNLGSNKDRILVAINKADMAMSGHHWNNTKNQPDFTLTQKLEEQVKSVRRRIRESTGVDIEPIYYSAGYKESEDEKQNPYNLSKLLYYIIMHTPKQKRLVYVNNISKDDNRWKDDDGQKDYSTEIKKSFGETVTEYATKGAYIGGEIGEIFGSTGKTIGKVVGGAVGGAVGAATKVWDWLFG